MQLGQVVYSKQGRDKGSPFVVVKIQSDKVFLTDGNLRKIHKPKKKNLKHIHKTKHIHKGLQQALLQNTYIKDSDVRSALKMFVSNES